MLRLKRPRNSSEWTHIRGKIYVRRFTLLSHVNVIDYGQNSLCPMGPAEALCKYWCQDIRSLVPSSTYQFRSIGCVVLQPGNISGSWWLPITLCTPRFFPQHFNKVARYNEARAVAILFLGCLNACRRLQERLTHRRWAIDDYSSGSRLVNPVAGRLHDTSGEDFSYVI